VSPAEVSAVLRLSVRSSTLPCSSFNRTSGWWCTWPMRRAWLAGNRLHHDGPGRDRDLAAAPRPPPAARAFPRTRAI